MSMRIKTNVSSLTAQRHLGNNQSKMEQSIERLSSGNRINKSADDAAGLAISDNMRSKIRGLNVAKRNANDGVSMIQIAEGSMNEMTNILVRLRELTVQSATDTVGSKERSYLNKEYVQLVDEIDRIANTTEFNSTLLFSKDTDSTYVLQVGVNNPMSNITDPDNSDTLTIDLAGLQTFNSADLDLSGSTIGPETVDDDGPDTADIAANIDLIDSALTQVATERATLGSIQSRLGSALNNLAISVESTTTAKSRIKDTDFAAEATNLSQQRILSQASTSVLAQSNVIPELALSLLR